MKAPAAAIHQGGGPKVTRVRGFNSYGGGESGVRQSPVRRQPNFIASTSGVRYRKNSERSDALFDDQAHSTRILHMEGHMVSSRTAQNTQNTSNAQLTEKVDPCETNEKYPTKEHTPFPFPRYLGSMLIPASLAPRSVSSSCSSSAPRPCSSCTAFLRDSSGGGSMACVIVVEGHTVGGFPQTTNKEFHVVCRRKTR